MLIYTSTYTNKHAVKHTHTQTFSPPPSPQICTYSSLSVPLQKTFEKFCKGGNIMLRHTQSMSLFPSYFTSLFLVALFSLYFLPFLPFPFSFFFFCNLLGYFLLFLSFLFVLFFINSLYFPFMVLSVYLLAFLPS